jgi:hypothetical protein
VEVEEGSGSYEGRMESMECYSRFQSLETTDWCFNQDHHSGELRFECELEI